VTHSCVLTFHRVVERRERDHDLEWPAFRALIDRLDPGRVSASLRPASRPGGDVVLTFDDATADHRAVGELLTARGLSAIFFAPSGYIDEPGRLSTEDLRALTGMSHEVGGHGASHRPLDELDMAELREEVKESRDGLLRITGSAPRWFAPPGGRAHQRLSSVLQEHGFEGSRGMRWGLAEVADDPWDVPTIPVTHVTVARGWVDAALQGGTLPLSMRLAWIAKTSMPDGARRHIRAAVHRRVGSRA
jgi:peptidoglycan/xylan/chitin deacetylase (PgdA/CDA1 family)